MNLDPDQHSISGVTEIIDYQMQMFLEMIERLLLEHEETYLTACSSTDELFSPGEIEQAPLPGIHQLEHFQNEERQKQINYWLELGKTCMALAGCYPFDHDCDLSLWFRELIASMITKQFKPLMLESVQLYSRLAQRCLERVAKLLPTGILYSAVLIAESEQGRSDLRQKILERARERITDPGSPLECAFAVEAV